MAVGHLTIFAALNSAIGDSKHKCEHDPFPSSKNGVSSATIRVRARHRPSSKELVENWLKVYAKKNGLSYEEKDYPSISSHECIEIYGFLKSAKTQTLRNKEKLRIFFKFLDGADKPDYSDIWNSGLYKAFEKKKGLKITPKNDYEVEVMTTINKRIEEIANGAGITLKVGNGLYHDEIVGCVGVKGNKHADLVLVDIKGNEKIYVSYKDGSTATSFQQYSGITKRAGKTIANHTEVKQWVKDIEDNWDDEQKESPKTTLHRSISSDNLKKKAVWGHEIGAAGGGYNNCNIFAQGKPKIDDSSTGRYKLEFTKVVNKGNLTKLTGDYDPTLGARKGEAYRRVGTKSGVRGGIFTKAYLTNRKNKEFGQPK